MDCLDKCPYLAESTHEQQEHCFRLSIMRAKLAGYNENATQNAFIAEALSKLTNNTPKRAEATAILQESVILVSEAITDVCESMEVISAAIEARHIADEAVLDLCPGYPVEIQDQERPGQMVLSCASLAFSQRYST